MITGKQIRAARVLAEWDAGDLAQKVGMSRISIQNIERGISHPKEKTIEKIVKAFAEVGIEFTENEGIRRRPEGVEIFEGPKRFDEFYDFLYYHMLEKGGDVCLYVAEESLLAKYRSNPEIQRQRVRKLVKEGRITYKVIVAVGDFSSDYAEYRQIPENHGSAPTAFYVFGESLAFITFPLRNSPHVIVIKSKSLVQAYYQFFYAVWEKSIPVSKKNMKKLKGKNIC